MWVGDTFPNAVILECIKQLVKCEPVDKPTKDGQSQ